MKKILFIVALTFSIATFAQKDELKALKKIYSRNTISENDLKEYKSAYEALSSMELNESDNTYYMFYKTMYPTVVLASKGSKVTMQDQMILFTPEFVEEYSRVIDNTILFESKTGKKIYTDDLIQEKQQFSETLRQVANVLNKESKFQESSLMFYNLYLFDKINQGSALENAAILSFQAEDYLRAENLYIELLDSDYLKNGVKYYAVNKASGVEEVFNNRGQRLKFISLKTHEKPRDEKNSIRKKEFIKMLAILTLQNGNIEKAKPIFTEALKLNPNDKDLLTREFSIYFNEGFEYLKEDDKIVKEINANLKDKEKYNDLVAKRNGMYRRALPNFEKAYQINPTDENTKKLLIICYETLGMKEKALTVK